MAKRPTSKSIFWLQTAIEHLPADQEVPLKTLGYNVYQTQKAHWLGWLDLSKGTGAYSRSASDERDARDVYNRIVEPKMLIWLADTAGVDREKLRLALIEAGGISGLASKSAAVRRHIPWPEIEQALGKMSA